MTEHDLYLFDLTGFLVLPGILTMDQILEIKDHIARISNLPESLNEHDRQLHGGPASVLIAEVLPAKLIRPHITTEISVCCSMCDR